MRLLTKKSHFFFNNRHCSLTCSLGETHPISCPLSQFWDSSSNTNWHEQAYFLNSPSKHIQTTSVSSIFASSNTKRWLIQKWVAYLLLLAMMLTKFVTSLCRWLPLLLPTRESIQPKTQSPDTSVLPWPAWCKRVRQCLVELLPQKQCVKKMGRWTYMRLWCYVPWISLLTACVVCS